LTAGRKQRVHKNSLEHEVKLRRSLPPAFPWPAEAFRFDDEARQSRAEAIAATVWRNRVPEDWLPADKLQICLFATTCVTHQDAQGELANSTYLVQSEGSRMARPNPLVAVVQQLANTCLSTARALAITGTQTSRKVTVQDHAKQMLAHHPHESATEKDLPRNERGEIDYSELLM